MSNEKRDPYTLFGYKIKNDTATKVIDEVIQTSVGVTAGVYFSATEKPFYDAPEDGKFTQENRQDFAERLDKLEKDPETRISPEALYKVKLLQNQNNTQEAWKQPVPKEPVDKFFKSIENHKKMDIESIEKTGKPASCAEHKKQSLKDHKEEAEAFKNSGVVSGYLVHATIGPAKDHAALAIIDFEDKELTETDDQDRLSRFGIWGS
jgi:hypothetical protein